MGIDVAPFLYVALAVEILLWFVCAAVGYLVIRALLRRRRSRESFQRVRVMRSGFEKPGFCSREQPGNV